MKAFQVALRFQLHVAVLSFTLAGHGQRLVDRSPCL